MLDGDPISLYYCARGLMQLQRLYGVMSQWRASCDIAVALQELMLDEDTSSLQSCARPDAAAMSFAQHTATRCPIYDYDIAGANAGW